MKMTIKMSMIFDAYASRKGVRQPSDLQYFLDGDRINETYTPALLEMEDHAKIDCSFAPGCEKVFYIRFRIRDEVRSTTLLRPCC